MTQMLDGEKALSALNASERLAVTRSIALSIANCHNVGQLIPSVTKSWLRASPSSASENPFDSTFLGASSFAQPRV